MDKKGFYRSCISILLVSSFLIFSTCFIFLPNHTNMAGALSFLNRIQQVSFDPISEDICLVYNAPISDALGITTEPYQFQVVNHGSKESRFQITFHTGSSEDRLSQKTIHYVLQKEDGEYSEIQTLSEDGIILLENISANSTSTYALKFWVHNQNELSDLEGKTFQGIIELDVVS